MSDISNLQFTLINYLLITGLTFIFAGDSIPPIKRIVKISVDQLSYDSNHSNIEVENLSKPTANNNLNIPTYEYLANISSKYIDNNLKLSPTKFKKEINKPLGSGNNSSKKFDAVGNSGDTNEDRSGNNTSVGHPSSVGRPLAKEKEVVLPRPEIIRIEVQ